MQSDKPKAMQMDVADGNKQAMRRGDDEEDDAAGASEDASAVVVVAMVFE